MFCAENVQVPASQARCHLASQQPLQEPIDLVGQPGGLQHAFCMSGPPQMTLTGLKIKPKSSKDLPKFLAQGCTQLVACSICMPITSESKQVKKKYKQKVCWQTTLREEMDRTDRWGKQRCMTEEWMTTRWMDEQSDSHKMDTVSPNTNG